MEKLIDLERRIRERTEQDKKMIEEVREKALMRYRESLMRLLEDELNTTKNAMQEIRDEMMQSIEQTDKDIRRRLKRLTKMVSVVAVLMVVILMLAGIIGLVIIKPAGLSIVRTEEFEVDGKVVKVMKDQGWVICTDTEGNQYPCLWIEKGG